jgi:hypothetical protein
MSPQTTSGGRARIEDPPVATGSDQAVRRLTYVMVVALVGLVLLVVGDVRSPLPYLGWFVVTSLTPALALVAIQPRRWVLLVGLAVCLVPVAIGFADRLTTDDPRAARHDGGVAATEAAADDARHGRNPYTEDFTAELGAHRILPADKGRSYVNPLVRHYPYLPGAFLAEVPVTVVAGWVGASGDPRWIYAAVFGAVVALLATRPAPPWARAAALLVLGANLAVATGLAWGANDTAAAGLLVLAAYLAVRRPWWAGVLAGLALSFKVLLIVAVVPVVVVLARRWGRATALRFVGGAAALLAVSGLPYFLASPGDFVEDTISFNLGKTDLTYPTSGIGFGAMAPGTFTDGVILVSSVLLLAAAGVATWWCLRRRPTLGVALACGALLVVAGLLPARTFQVSYLPLPVVLLAPIWTEARARTGSGRADPTPDPAT